MFKPEETALGVGVIFGVNTHSSLIFTHFSGTNDNINFMFFFTSGIIYVEC